MVVAANNVELIRCLQVLALYGQGRAFARFAVWQGGPSCAGRVAPNGVPNCGSSSMIGIQLTG